jgi:hypothetical protein
VDPYSLGMNATSKCGLNVASHCVISKDLMAHSCFRIPGKIVLDWPLATSLLRVLPEPNDISRPPRPEKRLFTAEDSQFPFWDK